MDSADPVALAGSVVVVAALAVLADLVDRVDSAEGRGCSRTRTGHLSSASELRFAFAFWLELDIVTGGYESRSGRGG